MFTLLKLYVILLLNIQELFFIISANLTQQNEMSMLTHNCEQNKAVKHNAVIVFQYVVCT